MISGRVCNFIPANASRAVVDTAHPLRTLSGSYFVLLPNAASLRRSDAMAQSSAQPEFSVGGPPEPPMASRRED